MSPESEMRQLVMPFYWVRVVLFSGALPCVVVKSSLAETLGRLR